MTTDETVARSEDGATRTASPTPRPPLRIITRTGTIVALLGGAVFNNAASMVADGMFASDDMYSGEGFAANGQLVLIAPALNLIAIPLMLLGLAGLFVLASVRSPLMSRLALGSTTVGMLAFFAMTASALALYSAAVDSAPDVPEAVLDALVGAGGTIAFPILFFTFMIANPLGILFAVIAFLRSRVVPVWATIALLAFAVSDFGLPSIPYFDWHLLFLVFAIGAAISVARSPRDAWYPTRP